MFLAEIERHLYPEFPGAQDSDEDEDKSTSSHHHNDQCNCLNEDDDGDTREDPVRPELISAVINNDLEKVKELLEAGSSPNVVDETDPNHWYTPLHYAVINQNEEIFDYLLTVQDLQIDAKDRYLRMTPLILAVHRGRRDFVEKLINKGADINISDESEDTLLHHAIGISLSLAVMLIEREIDINSTGDYGSTPLQKACQQKEWDFVHMLLYYGADAMVCNETGATPFMECLWDESVPELEFEILFNYSFDEVKDGMKLSTLIGFMTKESPIFYQIVEKVSHVLYTEDDLYICRNSLLDVECDRFKIFVDKFPECADDFFKLSEMKMSYHTALHIFYDPIVSNLFQCIYTLCESPHIENIVQKHLHPKLLILLFRAHLPENTVTEFVCCLLSYGFPIRMDDLDAAYHYYGFGNLFKILLHMDVTDYSLNRDTKNLGITFFPQVVYDINLSFDDFLKIPEEYQSESVLVYMRKFFTLDRKTSVPSLQELSREMARKHIIQTYKIKNNVQYFTIVKYLLGTHCMSILTYEKEIY